MVTDKAAYIGTSNWSHDYFLRTTGVGLVILRPQGAEMLPVQQELRAIFERDWSSPYEGGDDGRNPGADCSQWMGMS
uniref:PLD phosphodiesterase domain-containing protein n=1 Tax=Monodelphis domestica TaxID=13616 RepID=A0A5F8H2C5_MONDO